MLINPEAIISIQINYWLEKVKPYIERLGYKKYEDCIRNILEKGNSSSRQQNVMKRTGNLLDVVRHNILEFDRGEPIWE